MNTTRGAIPSHEAGWAVTLLDDAVEVTTPGGAGQRLSRTDLRAVAIGTNGRGPWSADFWWLLFGADDRLAVAFPQGSTGEPAVMDWLVSLPGFDHAAMIGATTSTEEAVFAVWRRPPD